MPLARIFSCRLLLLAFAGPASAQATLVPIKNFIDVPVTTPSSAARVKSAIVRSALILWWDVTEAADGSLIVSKTKVDDYAFKFKVSFDANKYSVSYVDSSGLRFNDGRLIDASSPTYLRSDSKQTELYKAEPESAFAVKTGAYLHPFYEESVRQLLAGIRRHLNAPI